MAFKHYRNAPVELRFWTKVQKSDSCWIWQAATNKKGYGIFVWEKGGGARVAHRIAYEQTIGPVPAGMVLDHVCRNKSCVNPAHLRPIDNRSNAQNRAGANRGSASGLRGVGRHSCGKWQANGGSNGKNYYLGLYDTPEEAARVAAEWRRNNMECSDMDREGI